MNSWKPKVISLFSGIGGMDLGFKRAGMSTLLEVENDPVCIKSLRANKISRRVMEADVFCTKGSTLVEQARLPRGGVDVVIGGPSCQPFSRSNEGRRLGIRDPRGRLILEFARIVHEVRPTAFVMENVRGLVSSNEGRDLQLLLRRLVGSGYQVTPFVLNCADYGAPQKRHRLLIVGLNNGETFTPPERTHSERDDSRNGHHPYVTADDAIGDLDDGVEHDGAESVGGMYGHLLNKIPPGMNYLFYTREMGHRKPIFRWRSKFWTFLLKLDPANPSNTIQATPGPYVGPFHWGNRRLTLTEVKRLQTIPDDWKVAGSKDPAYTSHAWRQIGNAVPPIVAEAIGRRLIEVL